MKKTQTDLRSQTRFDYNPQLVWREEGNYERDPAYFDRGPLLPFDAILKQRRIILELITDPEMYRMLVVWKTGDPAPTRASHQGRSRGSRVT